MYAKRGQSSFLSLPIEISSCEIPVLLRQYVYTQWITSAISNLVIIKRAILQKLRPRVEVSFCASLMALRHHGPTLTGA